jgi:hypothetical protein
MAHSTTPAPRSERPICSSDQPVKELSDEELIELFDTGWELEPEHIQDLLNRIQQFRWSCGLTAEQQSAPAEASVALMRLSMAVCSLSLSMLRHG